MSRHKASAKLDSPNADRDVKVEDLDEALEVIPFTYAITAYGADYPVDSIVKRMETEDIVVPRFSWESPKKSGIVGFQRESDCLKSTMRMGARFRQREQLIRCQTH